MHAAPEGTRPDRVGWRVGAAVPAWAPVAQLAWPATLQMLCVTLVFGAERVLAARIGEDALASLQFSTLIGWAATTLFGAVALAVGALSGQALGARDARGAARFLGAGVAIALGVGGSCGLALLAIGDAVAARCLAEAGAPAVAEARGYLAAFAWVIPLGFVEAVAAAALAAAGDTKRPLVAGALGGCAGLIVSAVFSLGLGVPSLGTRGLALGAGAAYAIELALLGPAIAHRMRALGSPTHARVAPALAEATRRIGRMSAPALLERLVYAGGYVAFAAAIARLGGPAMAANQALVSLDALAALSAEGIGIAALSLVARQLGAGRGSSAAYSARSALALAVVLLSAIGLVFVAASRTLLRPLCPDATVLAQAQEAMSFCALALPFVAITVTGRMVMRGAGCTRDALLVTGIGTLLVRLPLAAWIVSRPHATLSELWAAAALDWVVEAALVAGWLTTQRHRLTPKLGPAMPG